MTRICTCLATLCLLGSLAGCGGTPAWTKPGATSAVIRGDYAECQDEAGDAVTRDENIDSDIMTTRGRDWERTDTLGAKKETLDIQNQGHASDVIALCMKSKGYAPAR